jgi:hypothetical protein
MDINEYQGLKCDFCGRGPARPVVVAGREGKLFVCERWWCRLRLMMVEWAHFKIHG